MEICPVCQYRDPASFKNKPLTNEMRKYVNKKNPKEVAIFNNAATEFTDANGVEWVAWEDNRSTDNLAPAPTPKPPTIVKEEAFSDIPKNKPVIPLPQM